MMRFYNDEQSTLVHLVDRRLRELAMSSHFNALVESTNLPPELIIQILDFACIWLSVGETEDIADVLRCGNAEFPINKTLPLSAIGAKRLRQAIFRIKSRDQGWSSDVQHRGTFEHSWSWFDARLLDKHGKQVGPFEVQRNRHAGQDFEHHMAVFHPEHELIQKASAGDCIQLWMCARYPGWQNRVASATIELRFFDAYQDDRNLLFEGDPEDTMDQESEQRMMRLQV